MSGRPGKRNRPRSSTPEASSSREGYQKRLKEDDEQEQIEGNTGTYEDDFSAMLEPCDDTESLEEENYLVNDPKGKGKKNQDRNLLVRSYAKRAGATYAQNDAVVRGIVAGTVDLGTVAPFEIDIPEELNNMAKLRRCRQNLKAVTKDSLRLPPDPPVVMPTKYRVGHIDHFFNGPVLQGRVLAYETLENPQAKKRKDCRYVIRVHGTEQIGTAQQQIESQSLCSIRKPEETTSASF